MYIEVSLQDNRDSCSPEVCASIHLKCVKPTETTPHSTILALGPQQVFI